VSGCGSRQAAAVGLAALPHLKQPASPARIPAQLVNCAAIGLRIVHTRREHHSHACAGGCTPSRCNKLRVMIISHDIARKMEKMLGMGPFPASSRDPGIQGARAGACMHMPGNRRAVNVQGAVCTPLPVERL